jgi:hypothetical protein
MFDNDKKSLIINICEKILDRGGEYLWQQYMSRTMSLWTALSAGGKENAQMKALSETSDAMSFTKNPASRERRRQRTPEREATNKTFIKTAVQAVFTFQFSFL